MPNQFKKGNRVEYTWPGLGAGPFTDQGTVLIAHRDGSITVQWDNAAKSTGGRQWMHTPHTPVRKVEAAKAKGDA